MVLFAIGGNMPYTNHVPLEGQCRLTLLAADAFSCAVAMVSKIQTLFLRITPSVKFELREQTEQFQRLVQANPQQRQLQSGP